MMGGRQCVARWATVVVVVVIALVAGWNWEPLYLAIRFDRTYYVTAETAGWFYVCRLTGEQSDRQRAWHVETGFLAVEQVEGSRTDYSPDGRVSIQFSAAHEPEFRIEPPWLFGVEDQPAPTAPWLAEGSSFREWWANVPDEEKE